MVEYRLQTVDGRELLIRPCAPASRPQLQIAIVSTHGNLTEAVSIEASDVLGLARGVARVARETNDLFARALERKQREDSGRLKAARARNPWQTLSSAELKRKGFV